LRVVNIPNRGYLCLTLILLMLCGTFLLGGMKQIRQYALNTRNHFTHAIYINFPDRNTENFADMNAYTDMVLMGIQKIPGIAEAQLQKISAPFVDQYAYQMVVDIIISDDPHQLIRRLDQFCLKYNLILQDFGECPVFAKQVNIFMLLVGLGLLVGILYFFMTLLKLTLIHERQKIHTLQLMGAPCSMIGMLFRQEMKRIIMGMVGCMIMVMFLFYGARYYQTTSKAEFFSQQVLYINTLIIPLAVGVVTTLLTRFVLYTGLKRQ
jgi:hypothetical protein